MHRTQKIFLAFSGRPIKQRNKIYSIEKGYEVWDLNKLSIEEFVNEIKKKIPPVNKNVLCNYQKDTQQKGDFFGLSKKQYEQASWGILLSDTLEKGVFSYPETTFLLNLYSPHFLFPLFDVNDMGIRRQDYDYNLIIHSHTQDHSVFKSKKFVDFYKLLLEQSGYGSWYLNRIQSWNKEDWRLFTACLLYSGLKDYENGKTSFGWQRESAEMSTILESLFTAGDSRNEEVMYRLRKRVAVLLSWNFSEIEKDIRDLYKARSQFVHGSFFEQIAKDSRTAHNNLPIPNFEILYKHKEYVRLALVSYLYLAKLIKENKIKGVESVMDALEKAIIDTSLRKVLLSEVKKLFRMMPKATLKRM